MKNNIFTKITQVAIVAAFSVLVSVASQASAQTYFIDPTGQGCNASCQQLLSQYFVSTSSNNASSTSNSNSNSSNGSTTAATGGNGTDSSYGNPNAFPYSQYSYFPSSVDYYNGGSRSASATTAATYPYQLYSYFPSSNQPTNVGTSGYGYNSAYGYTAPTYSYPNSVYTYYGQSATQTQQYQRASQPVATTSLVPNQYGYGYPTTGYSNQYGYGTQYPTGSVPTTPANTGFVMTSSN